MITKDTLLYDFYLITKITPLLLFSLIGHLIHSIDFQIGR